MTAGKWALRTNGKFGVVAGGTGLAIKTDTSSCDDCCPVCDGYDSNPDSFTETWADADDWTVVHPPSGFAEYETLSYDPTLFVESDGDTDNYRATWTRYIRKTSMDVDSMRIGFSVPVRSNWTSDIVSPFPQRSVFVTLELKYGSTSILKIVCSYTASEFGGSAVNSIAWTGTGSYSHSVASGNPFVDGVDVEIVWTRLSSTTFNIKAYKDGSLLNTSSTKTITVENDLEFGCELEVIQTVDQINVHAGSTLETQVDDTFAEIVSS